MNMSSPTQQRGNTLSERIRFWAKSKPDKEVFVFVSPEGGRRALTCRDVHISARKCATLLQRLGVKKGDIVCNTLPNSPERIICDFGIIVAGGVSLHGQLFLADGSDIVHVLNKSNCRFLISDQVKENGAWDVLKSHIDVLSEHIVKSTEIPNLKHVVFTRTFQTSDSDFLSRLTSEGEPKEVSIHPSDDAYIWTTSGSTGFSKLCPHSHGSLLGISESYYETCEFNPDSVYFHDTSVGWAGGFPYTYFGAGMKRVMHDGRSEPPKDPYKFFWNIVCREQCTAGSMTPLFMSRLVGRADLLQAQPGILDLITITGQPAKKNCISGLGSLTKSMSFLYGLTETDGAGGIVCRTAEDFEDYLVGYPPKGVKVKIVDENLVHCPVGQLGEILVRSPRVIKEYLNDPEKTKKAFTEDGFFHTDDLGCLDQNGRLFVEGRRSDGIMRGPYLVHPSWLEKRLRACSEIDEVVVVPVPDALLVNELCACMIPKRNSKITTEEVKRMCEEMFVTKSTDTMTAVPKYYLLMDEFPTNNNGKVIRKDLEKVAKQMLGLE